MNTDRVEHLNRMLRAVRNVNQLIVREHDPDVLLREISRELVETRGFSDSWIALTGPDGGACSFCESGWGGECLTPEESAGLIDWCKCAAECYSQEKLVTVPALTGYCASCCLSARCHDAVVVTAPLIHDNRKYGIIGVTIEKKAFTEEDAELVKEIASDLSFALNAIETEASRRKLEIEARRYLDIAGVMIVVLAPDGRIRLVNRKAAEILGYQEEEMIGRDWFSLCVPDPDAVRPVFQRIIDGHIEQAEYYVNLVVSRDGSVRTISWHNAVIKDESGYITGTISSGEDITRQRLSEMALQKSEENYRNSLDSSPLGIRIYNTDDITLYANRAFLEIYGVRDLEEFESIPFSKRYSPQSYRMLMERKKGWQGQENIPATFNVDILRKDGTVRHLFVSRKKVQWDGSQHMQGVYQDITEQTLAEERVRDSEIKYHSLVNNVKLGIFRLDPAGAGKYIEVNPAMEEITGYTRGELLNMQVSELYSNPEDRTGFIEQVLKSRDKISGEFRFKKKNGREIVVSITDNAIRDDTGKVVFVDGILEDITERKQNEARLLEVESLKQSNKAKSELLANVSHELRTPLASIKGFIETLLEDDVIWSREQQEDFLTSANKETDRLNFLIRDLLDMSRLESGKMVLERKHCSIEELFDTVRNVLDSLTVKHNLVYEIPAGLPEVYVDKARIGQVITNLVENATKFSRAGSMISVGVKPEKERVMVEVQDRGEGMSPEVVNSLFDRFFQAKRVVSGKTRGTGLGLAICKGIIEAHGQKIRVESWLGQGSIFRFGLPLAKRDTREKA